MGHAKKSELGVRGGFANKRLTLRIHLLMGNQITEVTFRYFLIIIELGKLKSLCNVKRNNLRIIPASELDYGIPQSS